MNTFSSVTSIDGHRSMDDVCRAAAVVLGFLLDSAFVHRYTAPSRGRVGGYTGWTPRSGHGGRNMSRYKTW